MKTNFLKSTLVVALSLGTTLFSFGQDVWDGGANIPTTTTNGTLKIGQLNSASFSTTPTVKLQISENNPFIELVDNTGDTRAVLPSSGCGIRFSNYNSTFELKTVTNPLFGQGLFLSNTSSSSNQGISIFNNRVFLGPVATGGAPMIGKFGDVNISANASANRLTIANSNWSAPVLDPTYALGVYGATLIYGPVSIGTKKYIGTAANADYHLSVDGKVIAPSFYALDPTINWADYVFDKNYKLATLEEVESFVNENKHLPEVPSTNDVQTNGINLQQMDALLLKKVEELTLYMIEMKKEMQELRNRNKELEKQILK